MNTSNATFFSRVKHYIKLSQELQSHLSKRPDDCPRFQEVFNAKVDEVSQNILDFEKINVVKDEARVYKLKRIFEKRYRHHFLYGDYPKWTYNKPFGYAGDFKIIEDIYKNQPKTKGFDRLWDNYFLQLAAAKATRERKSDFKKIIHEFIKKRKYKNCRIMNLASGPAREIKELLESDSSNHFSRVSFDCYDFDNRAIDYAKRLLNNARNVNFFQKNVVRLALKKDIKLDIPNDYDLIYSTGLFDYLDERVAMRLVRNLKKVLKKDGIILISNVRDKYSNSSVGLMEWATEWYLIYRTEEEFKKIFIDAGFSSKNLKIVPQHSKVMQYCFASNS